jgi:hypothetical protein
VEEVTFWKHSESEKYSPENVIELRHSEIWNWFNGLDAEGKKALNLGNNVVLGFPIDEVSDFCKRSLAERSRSIEILNIEDGDGVERGVLDIEVSVNAASGIEKIEYYLNDNFQYKYEKEVGGSYNGNVRISPSFADGKELAIKVVLYDEYGYTEEANVNVYVGKDSSKKPKLSDFSTGGGSGDNGGNNSNSDEDQETSALDPVINLSDGPGSIVIE